jgi:hypothetical protein
MLPFFMFTLSLEGLRPRIQSTCSGLYPFYVVRPCLPTSLARATSAKGHSKLAPALLYPLVAILDAASSISPVFATLTKNTRGWGTSASFLCASSAYSASQRSPFPSSTAVSCKLLAVSFPLATPNSFRMRTFVRSARNPFRMSSFKTKNLKLFRMSIYKKIGEGVPPAADAGSAEGEERSLHCGRDDRPSGGTISCQLGSFRSGAGNWNYKTIQTQRRNFWRWRQTRRSGAGHDALEGRLEALHFGLRADSDPNVSRPNRPGAADEDIASH